MRAAMTSGFRRSLLVIGLTSSALACPKAELTAPTEPAAPTVDAGGIESGEVAPEPSPGPPDPEAEAENIVRAVSAGEPDGLERVVAFLDRAEEAACVLLARSRPQTPCVRSLAWSQADASWVRGTRRVLEGVSPLDDAVDFIRLYGLATRSLAARDRVLTEIRRVHDPRPAVRDFLDQVVDETRPSEGDFGLFVGEGDALTPQGATWVNAVLALAELLDERAAPHLRSVLEKLNTFVELSGGLANLYASAVLLLGGIAVRAGGAVEQDVVTLLLELTDPDKYPERWTEQRSFKLRALSILGADLWRRLLAERPECAGGSRRGPGRQGAAAECPTMPPKSRAVREAEAEASAQPTDGSLLDRAKHVALRWALDEPSLDVRERIRAVLEVFACPMDASMGLLMLDRENRRVKALEQWCGDCSSALASLGRLAHAVPLALRDAVAEFLVERVDKDFFRDPETGDTLDYAQGTASDLYSYVAYRQEAALALGHLGSPARVVTRALHDVVFDATDAPGVRRWAGTALGIVADAAALDDVVDGFVSPRTDPAVREALQATLDAHFRFAALDELAPNAGEAEVRAIDALIKVVAEETDPADAAALPRPYLLGAWFASAARADGPAARLAELTRDGNAMVRKIALLALIGSANPDVAVPIFQSLLGPVAASGDASTALRDRAVWDELRDVYANVGTPVAPYVFEVRSAWSFADGTEFRRLQVLEALRDLGRPEFLRKHLARLRLTDTEDWERAVAPVGFSGADAWTPIAYQLVFHIFTFFETDYPTWLDEVFAVAVDPAADVERRGLAVDLLAGLRERGFLRAVLESLDESGDPALRERIGQLLVPATPAGP